MENTSDYFMPRPLLFCMKSEKSVCYSVPDNMNGAINADLMTVEEIHQKLEAGYKDMECGRVREASEAFTEFRQRHETK